MTQSLFDKEIILLACPSPTFKEAVTVNYLYGHDNCQNTYELVAYPVKHIAQKSSDCFKA